MAKVGQRSLDGGYFRAQPYQPSCVQALQQRLFSRHLYGNSVKRRIPSTVWIQIADMPPELSCDTCAIIFKPSHRRQCRSLDHRWSPTMSPRRMAYLYLPLLIVGFAAHCAIAQSANGTVLNVPPDQYLYVCSTIARKRTCSLTCQQRRRRWPVGDFRRPSRHALPKPPSVTGHRSIRRPCGRR